MSKIRLELTEDQCDEIVKALGSRLWTAADFKKCSNPKIRKRAEDRNAFLRRTMNVISLAKAKTSTT